MAEAYEYAPEVSAMPTAGASRYTVPMPAEMPSASEVSAAARRAGLAADAAELHGALCGWIAGGGALGPDWLARVLADPGLPAAEGPLAEGESGPGRMSEPLDIVAALARATA